VSAHIRQAQRSRLVIAISRRTAQDAIDRLGIDPSRIRVVYPAVGSLDDRTVPTGEGAQGPPGGRIELLFVGVPEPHKRPEMALGVLAALRRGGVEATLRFVGPQPSRDVRPLRALADRLEVADHMELLGQIPDAELDRLYRRSVLLAVSSIEGFGLPPVEAILSGGRVAATDTATYREVLGDAVEFASADAIEPLAEAAVRAARSRAPELARAALAARFSAAETARALIDAYEAADPR
jgi:glycosyltransferase involved in cell wall biosynthesis